MTDSPHDRLFKLVYGRPAQAAAYFRRFLPAEVAARLDLDRLERSDASFVDDTLKARHADLLFTAPLRVPPGPDPDDADADADATPRQALLYLLFEHQSTVDPTMPFRFLRYMVRIWERWLSEHPDATHLPPIIPLVLYQGERPWRSARLFPEMVPDATGELGRFVPSFEVLHTALRDLTESELDAIRDGVTRLLLLIFRHGRDADLLIHLPMWSSELLEAQLLQLLGGFLEYLLSVHDALDLQALGSTLRETLNPHAESTAMTVAEKLIEQGLKRGWAGAQRTTLQRLLTLRFGPLPPWAVEAIEGARSDVLDAWLDRVLDAESLDGVLGAS